MNYCLTVKYIVQGAHAGLTKSYKVLYLFSVLFLGCFHPTGLIKSYLIKKKVLESRM